MQSSKQEPNPPKKPQSAQDKPHGRGTITGILSADSLMIRQTGTSEDPIDGMVHLAWISAPRLGSSQRVEEPFAFDAREHVREKIIGKKCTFIVQYSVGGRRYLTVEVDKEDVALQLVQAGLAKVQEKRVGQDAAYDALVAAQEEPKTKKVGVWSTDEAYINKHLRQVCYFGESDYNPAKLLTESQVEAKPLAAILEHVFSASFVTLYVYKLKTVVRLNLLHLFTPKETDKDLVEAGKAFVDKLLLHKTVGLKLIKVDDRGELVGRVLFSAGEIAAEILKNGFCKLSTPKDSNFDAAYYKDLKQAQLVGQTKRAGMWKDFQDSDLQQNKSKVQDFAGRVVEVNSGDSVTVERESDQSHIRVYLSSVKAPNIGKQSKQGETPGDAYSWESKESLRKLAIGKKVRVQMEYGRTIQTKDGSDLTMNFGAVFINTKKGEKNVACVQLEKGLVRTNIMKTGENASKYLEDLLASEKKAQDSKLCLYSQKDAPMPIFADLVGNTKLAKEYEQMVLKRPDRRFAGVVEYCFSGMKYKVRLEDEGRSVSFNLLGIKTMSSDKNQPIFDDYANDALRFAKDLLFQRDVTIEIFFADKRGNFFGTLTMANKSDFATKLLEEGLAMVHLQGKSIVPGLDKLQAAEKVAQAKEIGIWGKSLKLMSTQQSETQFEPYSVIKVEITDVTEASRFHVRLLDKAKTQQKIDDAMAKFDSAQAEELERPIKKGTLCAAYLASDKSWYRVKVIGGAGKGQTEVYFIDYGNKETVESDLHLRKLPAHLLAYEPQAIQASFAFIRCPRATQQLGAAAVKYVEKYGMNTVHAATVIEQVGNELKLVLTEEDAEDWSSSLNAFILSEGLACLDKRQMDDAPDDAGCFYDYEEEAKEKQKGLWKNGPVANLSDDEY